MNKKSITFDTGNNKLIVTFDDGTFVEYLDANAYLADFPFRSADVIAMGWEIPDSWVDPQPVSDVDADQ